MEQRDQARAPLAVMHVHRVDTEVARARRHGARAAPGSPSRRSECTSLTARRRVAGAALRDRRAAHPEAFERVEAPRHLHQRARGIGRLHVDRAFERGTELRRRRRPCGARRARRARPRWSRRSAAGAGLCAPSGSWAQTTSPSAASHTSVSRPVTPASRAWRKAGIVFSGSSTRAPRWANVMGTSSLLVGNGGGFAALPSPSGVSVTTTSSHVTALTRSNPQAGPGGCRRVGHSARRPGAWFTRPPRTGKKR